MRRRKDDSKSPVREARMKRTLKKAPVSINMRCREVEIHTLLAVRLRLISAIALVPGLKRLGREVR